MIKTICKIVAIFIVNCLYSQNYYISFSGSGAATIVDSVNVYDLYLNSSLTLNGSDTLHLYGWLGINENQNSNGAISVMSNSFNRETLVRFNNTNTGNVDISIFDYLGRNLIHKNIYLHNGINEISLRGLKPCLYVIKIISSGSVYSEKFISTNNDWEELGIDFISYNSLEMSTKKNQYICSVIDMLYLYGQRLLLKGYSGKYSRVLTFIPDQNQTIDFEFVLCRDLDSNHYAVVSVGNQLWMAENLKSTKFTDGSSILYAPDSAIWHNLNSPGYTWFNNDITYKKTYGALYNWFTLNKGNPCPIGWHLPSDEEWTSLSFTLGGAYIAGGKMKEPGLDHWNGPNLGATNESGFTGLPGSVRTGTSHFCIIGDESFWWSTTEFDTYTSWYRRLSKDFFGIERPFINKRYGMSIRCIKDY